jgi:hypothetical protein
MLADALRVLAARGLLRVDDADLAAEQLTWLVVAAPLNRLTLQAGAHPYSAGELRALATQGITTFLAPLRARKPGPSVGDRSWGVDQCSPPRTRSAHPGTHHATGPHRTRRGPISTRFTLPSMGYR